MLHIAMEEEEKVLCCSCFVGIKKDDIDILNIPGEFVVKRAFFMHKGFDIVPCRFQDREIVIRKINQKNPGELLMIDDPSIFVCLCIDLSFVASHSSPYSVLVTPLPESLPLRLHLLTSIIKFGTMLNLNTILKLKFRTEISLLFISNPFSSEAPAFIVSKLIVKPAVEAAVKVSVAV